MLTYPEPVLNACATSSFPTEAEFDEMLAAQNEEMRSLGFQIKRLKHPQDKKVYIGFVNTVSVSKPVAGHRKLIVACLRKPATAACICMGRRGSSGGRQCHSHRVSVRRLCCCQQPLQAAAANPHRTIMCAVIAAG